jgi:hypothetical protein
MSLSKTALLAAALAFALPLAGVATKTFAQTQNTPGNMLSDVGEDEVVYLKAETGKVTKGKMKMTAAMHTKAMSMGAKEVDPKTVKTTGMVYKHGGKFYHVANKAGAAAGKTMVQENFQEVFDGNHQY